MFRTLGLFFTLLYHWLNAKLQGHRPVEIWWDGDTAEDAYREARVMCIRNRDIDETTPSVSFVTEWFSYRRSI